MSMTDTSIIDDKLQSIAEKQAQAQALREQLAFSVKIQSLFPQAFEGEGRVTLKPNMVKSQFVVGPKTYPVGCCLTDAAGQEHALSAKQYLTLFPDDYNERTKRTITRQWLATDNY